MPFQAWEEVINLADWMNTFDDDGSMENYLRNWEARINPITHPRSYWSHFWTQFMDKFQRTQLMDDRDQQLKLAKVNQFLGVLQSHETNDRVIMWAFCDGRQ